MKKFGIVLIVIGLGLVCALAFAAFTRQSSLISPVPDSGGIKVIYKNSGE